MAKTATYSLIGSTTLSTTAATIDFNSIPATFTDLVLVSSALTSTEGRDFRMRFNSDTGTNYSYTYLGGYTSVTSGRTTNLAYLMSGNFIGTSSAYPVTVITNIQDYANTTTYKTSLTRHNQSQANVNSTYTEVMAQVNLWRSTAAINTITLSLNASTFAAGSVFKLYGIQAGNA